MATLKEFASKIGNKAWFVGGCVRDKILGKRPKDFDIVVECSEEVLFNTLKEMGIPHDTVGKSFGVTKAKFSDCTVDIALPRSDRSTGVGHKDFEVTLGVTLEEDAKRRDFTMNAIFENVVTGEIRDPLQGKDDIEKKLLSTTSKNSFVEDPLRMLRAVQFAARFELRVDPYTAKDMKDNAKLINSVSAERSAIELAKLLLADRPSIGLNIMVHTGLAGHILPELVELYTVKQPAKFHDANAFDHTLRVVDAVRPDLNMRLAALFHDLGKATTFKSENGNITFHGHEGEGVKMAETIIDRLKLFTLEGFDKEMILILIGNHMFSMEDKVTVPAIRRLVRRLGGIDRFHDLIQLRVADKIGGANVRTTWKHLEFLRRVLTVHMATPAPSLKDLAVDGNDVMQALGIKPGKRVGDILKKLFEMVEDDLIENDKDTLLNCAKNLAV